MTYVYGAHVNPAWAAQNEALAALRGVIEREGWALRAYLCDTDDVAGLPAVLFRYRTLFTLANLAVFMKAQLDVTPYLRAHQS